MGRVEINNVNSAKRRTVFIDAFFRYQLFMDSSNDSIVQSALRRDGSWRTNFSAKLIEDKYLTRGLEI
jgi:hypothetical protein